MLDLFQRERLIKTELARFVTLAGIEAFVSFRQPEKCLLADADNAVRNRYIRQSGEPSKAICPMLVIVLGIIMFVRP